MNFELSFEQIKPHLSERGALEVELAMLRATVAAQGDILGGLLKEPEKTESPCGCSSE